MAAESKLEGLEKVRFLVENGVNVHTASEVSFTVIFLWFYEEVSLEHVHRL